MKKPEALKSGKKIGIFVPSSPAHINFKERFNYGLDYLRQSGFEVTLGKLVAAEKTQGYRAGSPIERADELNALFSDPEVGCIISTIGGSNSSSLIPYLDFPLIKESGKVFCGYSDVTSLHLAINSAAGLSTLYGPAIVPTFGEYPKPSSITADLFWRLVRGKVVGKLPEPEKWSNKGGAWNTDEWKTTSREWQENKGIRSLIDGSAQGESVVANLNTLVSLAGTPFFPDCQNKILFIEEMLCPLSRYERNLRHLQLLGVFDQISGLVISKPEQYKQENAPFSMEELLLETIGFEPNFPILTNFDCGHTHPLIPMPQGCLVRISGEKDKGSVELLESYACQEDG